jgi:hypothetical protein
MIHEYSSLFPEELASDFPIGKPIHCLIMIHNGSPATHLIFWPKPHFKHKLNTTLSNSLLIIGAADRYASLYKYRCYYLGHRPQSKSEPVV